MSGCSKRTLSLTFTIGPFLPDTKSPPHLRHPLPLPLSLTHNEHNGHSRRLGRRLGSRRRRKQSLIHIFISQLTLAFKRQKTSEEPAPKKPTSKITKAQRRRQQLEFNRQLWEEAEGPRQPNYFLETRGVVPKADQFKPPPRLLSRKAPPLPTELNGGDAGGSSGDDGEEDEKDKKKQLTIEEQRALREEKQRKYEERRLELFGSASTGKGAVGSATSSPSGTPPNSRSATPNRSRGRAGGGGGGAGGGGRKAELQQRPSSSASSLSSKPSSNAPGPAPSATGKKELYDPSYTPKPEPASAYVGKSESRENVIVPIRSPRGPDGSGRGGFGFAPRGGKNGPRRGGDVGTAMSEPSDSRETDSTTIESEASPRTPLVIE